MTDALSRLKILIADDNDTDRMILQAIVTKEGYIPLIAKNGLEAVALFRDQDPDIILMDAIMPEMDGMEAARIIKTEASNRLVPILFLTSLHSPESLAACLEAGGDDFLSKPYNPVILKAKINASIRLKEMHQQLHILNQNMLSEQQVAKSIFDKVAHLGHLDQKNIRYSLSPKSVFNGDTLLSAARPDGGLNFFLGDFTGHGLSAAIGAMPLAEVFYSMTARGYQISDIILEINDKLFKYLPTNFFCAAAMIQLDKVNQTVQLWTGGLPDVVLYSCDTGKSELLPSNHLPLGVISSNNFEINLYYRNMKVGDQIFLWSDGLHEAMNDRDELFGEQRVMSVFKNNKDPEKIFDQLIESMEVFVGSKEKKDDITLLAITMDLPSYKSIEIEQNTIQSAKSGSQDWEMTYRILPSSMKHYSPIPFLLSALLEVDELGGISNLLYTALSELYSNALEHGLLKLNSGLKRSPEGFSQYYREREQRLNALKDGEISIELKNRLTRMGGQLTISVQDSGDGFDSTNIIYSGNSNQNYAGRGLPLLSKIVDSLEFRNNGSHVVAKINWYNKKSPVS